MSPADNFISFHDLTPEGCFLWASPSIYDVLGYEPEELLGVRGYDILCLDDHVEAKEFHRENFINDLVASQIIIRYKAKDGRAVHCVVMLSICYDFVVNSATALDPTAEAYLQWRAHSSAMNRRVGSKKEEFERLKRHHQAFAEKSWDHQIMEPEARVCLILNRFTRSLVIMYASSACEKVFHVDPDDITGTPILLYIRADDLAPFVEQVNLIKATTAISQMRFWFQSPNWPQEIPCEAIVFGAADGIVAVVRKCKPFVRKYFIGSREQFEARSQGSSWSSAWTRSYGSSPASQLSASSPSPTDDCYGSESPKPLRNVSRATLNRVKILELGDERARSLISLPENDPKLIQEGTAMSEVPAFKEVLAQNYEDDEDSDDFDTMIKGVAISKLDDGDVDI